MFLKNVSEPPLDCIFYQKLINLIGSVWWVTEVSSHHLSTSYISPRPTFLPSLASSKSSSPGIPLANWRPLTLPQPNTSPRSPLPAKGMYTGNEPETDAIAFAQTHQQHLAAVLVLAPMPHPLQISNQRRHPSLPGFSIMMTTTSVSRSSRTPGDAVTVSAADICSVTSTVTVPFFQHRTEATKSTTKRIGGSSRM
ncbi:hypothetical protein GALMADRAFT_146420 [Galerina marginata CBS 339.88]|uniref:Uncharacterized protein n=1 Tax=Galerina marginata (strain CBS 339.88) TaxID=685588 RepID=A0A067SC83_GALM3|nr:hypothetical protein GALMADRAFT_146420 [Galerina marginata CBS 339.88]